MMHLGSDGAQCRRAGNIETRQSISEEHGNVCRLTAH